MGTWMLLKTWEWQSYAPQLTVRGGWSHTLKYVLSRARDNTRALRRSLAAMRLYPSKPRFKKLNIWAMTGAAGFEKLLQWIRHEDKRLNITSFLTEWMYIQYCPDSLSLTCPLDRLEMSSAYRLTQFKDQILVKETFVSPKNPAKPSIDETKFMSRCVDRDDSLDIERPIEMGVGERSNESPRCRVNVNGNIKSSAFLKIVHWGVSLVSWINLTWLKESLHRLLMRRTSSKWPV